MTNFEGCHLTILKKHRKKNLIEIVDLGVPYDLNFLPIYGFMGLFHVLAFLALKTIFLPKKKHLYPKNTEN